MADGRVSREEYRQYSRQVTIVSADQGRVDRPDPRLDFSAWRSLP